ncbi:uncharacterized protein LOC129893130 [Solanum dulcamara]|uniref:uncharacterized protein LOC129893130 n=1 Tax=Solanum dulcamara TaxID=45834 RepID=UPI002486B287|nr:uncharacterized protein LOC129893130 [Solanum dulcamara]
MTSNIAESINIALVLARELSIFEILEQVKLRWNHNYKKEATGIFTPLIEKYQDILIENKAMCTRMMVVQSTEYVHNVNDDGRNFIVRLREKICSYGRFQYEEISCEHAWAVLKSKNLTAYEYCFDLYKSETFLKIYELPIYPLPDIKDWVVPEYILDDVVLPPPFRIQPDRPRKKTRAKGSRELLGSV